MFRLGCLSLAWCVWISVAEEKILQYKGTDSEIEPQYTADPKYSYATKVIFTGASLLTFLVSVMGNCLVIYVITKHRSMRTSTNCLIMNLSVCDLLLTLLHTPLFLKLLYNGTKWLEGTVGNVICKLITSVIFLLLSCSVFNFVAIAVDRFLAVTRPLTYKFSTKWVVKIGIPAMWMTASFSSRDIFLEARVDNNDGTPKCVTSRRSSQDYLSALSIVASFVVLIVLYAIISYRLWTRNIPGEVSNNQHALAIRTARKVTVLMISVVIVFFVSWTPAFVVVLSELFDAESTFNILIYKKYPFLVPFCYWLILNSTACNPCLYFIFIESFREKLRIVCARYRLPKLRLCRRIGQDRRFETDEQMRNRQNFDILTQNERGVELRVYSTINNGVAS